MTRLRAGMAVSITRHDPTDPPWKGTVTAVGGPVPDIGRAVHYRWITVRMGHGGHLVVTDDKVVPE